MRILSAAMKKRPDQQLLPSLPFGRQSKWIDPELPHDPEARQPASYLRRRFTAKNTENACLYITCHGLYIAYINGRRAGDFVLAPGTGDYHRRLTVQRYDVSDLLKIGENEIAVTLGDGWYRGGVGIDGLRNYYGTDLALLCQLAVSGKSVLCSDESWEATQQGPIRENDLETGEVVLGIVAQDVELKAFEVATATKETKIKAGDALALAIRECDAYAGHIYVLC